MKILIAPDKFKGTLSAQEVAEAMAEGVRRVHPEYEIELIPLADGGEGTADILTRADEGQWETVRASDPMFRQVTCGYGVGFDQDVAYIDLAEASGMGRLAPRERNPLRTTTLGTGEIMAMAMRKRCKTLVLGLGGSSTMDLGAGIMHAMGVRFMDEGRNLISPTGGNLERIRTIDHSQLNARIPATKVLLLADVDSILLGEKGAMIYGRQKGLRDADRSRMLAGMVQFAHLLEKEFGVLSDQPGMGAAGGAAMGILSLFRGKIETGARHVMKTLNFKEAARSADLILTGEGRLDAQTSAGKTVAEVATQSAALGIPALAVAGTLDMSEREIEDLGLVRAVALYDRPEREKDSLEQHREAIASAVAELLKKS